MKKLLGALIAVVIVIFGIGCWFYYQADKVLPPIETVKITANDTEVFSSKMEWKTDVFEKAPSFMQNKIVVNKNVAIDRVIDEITLDTTVLKLEIPYTCSVKVLSRDGQEVFKSEGEIVDEINFAQKGKYDVFVKCEMPRSDLYKGYGTAEFVFFINVDPSLKINFPKEDIKQGDLIKVEIENIFLQDELKVESDFAISEILRTDFGAEFYIPITYYKPAQRYDLNIIVNGESFLNRYEVKEAQFSVIHFEVEESVSSSTVNSAAANQEYREKIHPLYKTKSTEKYWSGAFVKPVQEKRISSEFGQKRYVNNAKTPERHSGIDYAAPEGTPIYAPNSGKVDFAGFLKLSGYTIVIDHGLGLKSYYFHMNDVFVNAGDIVKTGDHIGDVGTTGYSTGPHLHFQVSIENQPINPELLYSYEG